MASAGSKPGTYTQTMRKVVEIANPRRHGETHTSHAKAEEYCRRGLAYWTREGKLKFREARGRAQDSDVFVDRRGVIYWNGARSHYVGEGSYARDIQSFPPGCNVYYPKSWTVAAMRRYA